MPQVELRLPDLDLGEIPVTVCSWHAGLRERVVEGDRLVEVLAAEVTIDLPAPATGLLVRRCVEMDEPLKVGQVLAVIEAS